MSRFREQSRRMALCGVLAALAVVLLSLGGMIPFATFCCPVLAMVCMVPVVQSFGGKTSLLFYMAVAILGLLLAPDKEVALLFVFLGYYPALRPRINAKIGKKGIRIVVKVVIFALSITLMYALAIQVLGMGYIAEEYAGAKFLLLATVLMGLVVWLLVDRLLGLVTILYEKKWKKKLFHQ